MRILLLWVAALLCPPPADDEIVPLGSLDLSLAKQGWNTPKADKSVQGRPLQIGGKTFQRGFGTHSVSDLAIDLKDGAQSFSATVGVDDETNGNGSVEFFVVGDGKILWRSGVLQGGDPAKKADVPLAGIKLLLLHVSDGEDGTGNDHADWADAAIATKGAKPVTVPLPKGPAIDYRIDGAHLTLRSFLKKAPKDYTATLFALPPAVSYPVAISAAPTGELFVSVDQNGSLDRGLHRGKIVRLVDTQGTGTADRSDDFVKEVDTPRGIYFDGETLYCLHPPFLTAYRDTDGDGRADWKKDLITGLGYGFDKHPGDHTSNGIREAIDGWIYMAIGDFGLPEARGTDGSSLTMRGGGVVRIRPDGSELEVYSYHTRNILDVAHDPYLNGFIYDNTNDGDGWNSRLSYLVGACDFGYPSLYLRFGKDLMPTLADFGGGSAVGTLFLHEPGFPEADGNTLFTCDWGTSHIYRHPLKPDGAGWSAPTREDWARVERVTDMDVDGQGRLYVSSWRGAVFNFAGPNVGGIIQLVPPGGAGSRFPDLRKATDADLLKHLASRSMVLRQQTQHEILRRGPLPAFRTGLSTLARSEASPLYARVAALFTLKSLLGVESHDLLLALADDPTVQEWALRALADRKPQNGKVPAEPFLKGLSSPNPRVQVQALIGLGRLGRPETAKAILPLTALRPEWKDAQLIIPHTARRVLLGLGAADVCLAALDPAGPEEKTDGLLAALKWMHDPKVVDGLIAKLDGAAPEFQKKVYRTLAHLYYEEGEWNRVAWWSTRPEHEGPYYQRALWAGSPLIEKTFVAAMAGEGERAGYVRQQIDFFHLKLGPAAKAPAGNSSSTDDVAQLAKALAAAKKTDPDSIGSLPYDKVLAGAVLAKGDVKTGEQLFTRQGCIVCHTVSRDVPQKGPFLGEVAKQYNRAELVESIVKPNAKIAQGFATHWFDTKEGDHYEGFIVREGAETIALRTITGVQIEIVTTTIAKRGEAKGSMMPEGLVNNLKPEDLASILAYFESMVPAKK
jgi:putative heme-binding domain-containing protein